MNVLYCTNTLPLGRMSNMTKSMERKRCCWTHPHRRNGLGVRAAILEPAKYVEKTAGRLAMTGFVSGTSVLVTTGTGYVDQFQDNIPLVMAFIAFIGFASLKTDNIEVWPRIKPFTPAGELLNGRLAMLGVSMRVLYEITRNSVY